MRVIISRLFVGVNYGAAKQKERTRRFARLPSRLFSTETYPNAYPWLHRDNKDDIPTLTNYINGEFVPSKATTFIEVKNPAKNEIISRVPER